MVPNTAGGLRVNGVIGVSVNGRPTTNTGAAAA